MVSGFKSASYTKVKPVVRATEHKTHWQTYGRSERIYYGDPRHDQLTHRVLTPVKGRDNVRSPGAITYRIINGEAVRV